MHISGNFQRQYSLRHRLLTGVITCALAFPAPLVIAADADPFQTQLQEFLAADPGHFNNHMWDMIQANPQAKDHIFATAVRLSLQKQVAADPSRKAELLAKFQQMYPELAPDLAVAVMPQPEAPVQLARKEKTTFVQSADTTPRSVVRLANDPDHYYGKGSSWWSRNWIWVALGAGAAGGGAAAAIAMSSSSSSGNSTAFDPFETPPITGEGPEYVLNHGLAQINAAAANDAGFTGKGILVAVVDTGLNIRHPDIVNNVAPGGYDFVNNTATITSLDETEDHGTHVAGIIAAGRNGFGTRGVAYDAQILPIAAIDPKASITAVNSAFNYASDHGAKILNASFGPVDSLTQDIFVKAGGQLIPDDVITEADSIVRAANKGMVFVFAAGNSYDASKPATDAANVMNSNPAWYGFLPYITPAHQNLPLNPSGAGFNPGAAPSYREWNPATGLLTNMLQDYSGLVGHLIAVVALNADNTIASFSNRCGVAAQWCVGAPGVDIVSTITGNEYAAYAGTSMAAPHVSGALAVLMSQHPELTPEQIVNLLLNTSTDLGAPGVDPIYGHGLINLAAATAAQGPFSLALGGTMTGPTALLTNSTLTASTAFGTSAFRALQGTQIGVLDAYTRNFTVALGSQIKLVPVTLDSMTTLRSFGITRNQQIALDEKTVASFSMKASDVKERADSKGGSTFDTFSLTRQVNDVVAVNVSHRDPRSSGLFYQESDRDLLSSQVAASGNGNPYLDFVMDGYANNVTLDTPFGGKFRALTAMGAPDNDHGQRNMLAQGEIGFGTAQTGVSFTSGALIEQDRILGLHGDGAFALGDGTSTMFAGMNGVWQVGEKTALQASLYGGFTRASGRTDSLIQGVDNITTSSWRVGVTQSAVFRDDDSVHFNIAQPMRAESGALNVNLPQYRLQDGTIIGQNASFNLAPTGREIDLEAGYRLTLSPVTKLDLAAMYRRDPGHVANTDEAIGLARVNHSF
jgi:subtilisin family serine protease